MNDSTADSTNASSIGLGPAVSPRALPRPSPLGDLSEPLAPFTAHPAASAPREELPSSPEPVVLDEDPRAIEASITEDFPWLLPSDDVSDPYLLDDETENAERVPSPALAEVAARLERIARNLRDGVPGDILARDQAADPLELLITGYALGYMEGRQSA